MPIRGSVRQRGTRHGAHLLQRIGEELRRARADAGLSLRVVAAAVGVSHTFVWRIERGQAPHVDVHVLACIAEATGGRLALGVHPVGTPVRDAAHLSLLARFRARLPDAIGWRTEVPVPIDGDLRSADAVIGAPPEAAMVEAETRLGDIQALERRMSLKARDLGVERLILLVLDSQHNRRVIDGAPELRRRFPIATRAALASLGRGVLPAKDCLILL